MAGEPKKIEYKNIREDHVSELREKIEKLNKKAVKIDCPKLVFVVSEPYKTEIKYDLAGCPLKNSYFEERFNVEILGETPRYENWIFIAAITGYPNGKNLITKNPWLKEDIDVSEYREKESHCDHCKIKRYRKNTYILYNTETKKLITCGSTCIKDFLGHPAPHFTVFSKMIELENENFDFSGPGKGPRFANLGRYLALSYDVIKKYGFTPRSKAEEWGKLATVETVDHVWFAMGNPNSNDREAMEYKISEAGEAIAEKIIEWGKNLKSRGNLNDYMYNLSVVMENELFEDRARGLVVSAVNTYLRETENTDKTEKKPSEYFGELKKRYDIEVTLDNMLFFENDFGPVVMHTFHADNGNVFIWWGSKAMEVGKDGYAVDETDRGKKFKIKATVKAHNEFKGRKQTVINRVVGLNEIK